MPVILIRHSRPAAAEGLCYGRSDVALADDFEAVLAAALAGLPAVGAVVTSPLGRCRRLAEAIAEARGLPLAEDPRLAEMDFGAWEGRLWSDLPHGELDAWAADFRGARPHGGESVAMLEARVTAELAEAPADPPPALWVSHAGVARAAAALTGRADGWNSRLDFGDWIDLRPPAAEAATAPAAPALTGAQQAP